MLRTELFWTRWLVPLFLLLCIPPLKADVKPYSLVINGAILDVNAFSTPADGHFLAADVFALVARADGKVSLEVRPDRGHIVLSTPVSRGTVAPIKGFKTAVITLVVNGTPLNTRGKLQAGVLFLDPLIVQQTLELLGFRVLMSHESALITVSRAPTADASTLAGPGGGAMGATDLLRALQAGGLEAGMAGDRAASGQAGAGASSKRAGSMASGASSATSAVCSAMDKLRTVWDQTEPSAAEKSTFRMLASKFQSVEQGQKPDQGDLARMRATLASFRKKVDRRTSGTAAWSAPEPAAQVKQLGGRFMDAVTETMDLCQKTLEAMQSGGKGSNVGDTVQRLRLLEQAVQEEGTQFNLEVFRVRQAHDCGPATLGLPPT